MIIGNLAAGVAALMLPVLALACGVCVEDKVAVVYDHALVQYAKSKGKVVVFCEVKGTIELGHARRVMSAVPGIQVRSIRVSKEPAAISFILDPAVLTPEVAVRQAEKALGGNAKLTLLRTLGKNP